MNLDKRTRLAQERELLALRCQLMRLKVQAAEQHARRTASSVQTSESTPRQYHLLRELAWSAGSLLTERTLLRLVMKPARLKHRLYLGGALVLWRWWNNRHSAPKR